MSCTELEQSCDLAVERILVTLGRTFITPFDRENIHDLATSLDDVLDYIEESAFRLTTFRIEKPTPEAVQMAFIIQKSCQHVVRAVHLCRGNLGSDEMSQELRESADSRTRRTTSTATSRPPCSPIRRRS